MNCISQSILKTMLKFFLAASIGLLLLLVWTSSTYVAPQVVGVEVGPNHIRQVTRNQGIVYHHVLTNTGTMTDSFFIEVLSTQDWPVMLVGGSYPSGTAFLPVLVGPQKELTFQVHLTVPIGVGGATDVTLITTTSQLSPTIYATATNTSIVWGDTYLPVLLKYWPPLPYAPSLDAIQNGDFGAYTVSWVELPTRYASNYTLEEATDAAFTTNLRIVCATNQQSCEVSDRGVGTYYYRVRGHNSWGAGRWSNVQAATVLWPDAFTRIHFDDFNNASTGWPNGATSFGSAYYDGGKYHLVNDSLSGYYSFAGVSPDWIVPNDIAVKVEGRVVSAPTGSGASPAISLVFGLGYWDPPYQEYWKQWYEFRVCPTTQYYALVKWFGYGGSSYDRERLKSGNSSAILSNLNETQVLEVQREGNEIAMFVNGVKVGHFIDNDNPYSGEGSAGVGTGDFFHTTFDNFEVGAKTRP